MSSNLRWMRARALRAAVASATMIGCAALPDEPMAESRAVSGVLEISGHRPSHHLTFPSYFYSFGEHTTGGDRLQLLLQNTTDVTATATVRFLFPDTDRPVDVVTTARTVVVPPGQAVSTFIGRPGSEQYFTHGPDYEMRFDTRVDADQPLIGIITPAIDTSNGPARAAIENAPPIVPAPEGFALNTRIPRVHILTATYGGNCGAPSGNVTLAVQELCEGRTYCTRRLTAEALHGDPVPGCAKALHVEYACAGAAPATLSVPPEAQGRLLEIRCRSFDDVARAHPFFRQISTALARGFALPCASSARSFCPDQPATRGEVAVMVLRALYGPDAPVSQSRRFNDVPPWHPHFAAINRFGELGITAGCGDGNFCPERFVTRGEISVFVVRAMQIRAGLPFDSFSYPSTPYFTDVAETHHFFRFVQRFRSLGITTGCSPTSPTTYCVDGPTTRGQLATFLTRALP